MRKNERFIKNKLFWHSRNNDNSRKLFRKYATQSILIFLLFLLLARGKVKKLIFATVDKSPHCIQLHYVIKELENAIDISNIEIINYVATENKLIKIPIEVISLSKNLSKLSKKILW